MITSVEAHASWEDIAKEWQYLEQMCPVSGYQTLKWAAPWLRTSGAAMGLEPLLILARDATTAPAALFALAVDPNARVRVASYIGGRDSNINMPLVRPDIRLDASAIRDLLTKGARAGDIDAYLLLNQPTQWREKPHPLSYLPAQPSPSLLHGTQLPPNGEAIIAQMSGDTRKRMRWRLRKLQEIGEVGFMQARTRDEICAVVAAFRQQKKVRIDAMGVAAGFDVDLTASFLEEAALAEEPGMELHALTAGDRIVATYGGVVHSGCYHAMVNSYETEPEIARTSPGELVIIRLLQSLSDRGISSFDLGVGEAAYKDKWCDRHDPLFDTIYGVSAKGRAYAFAQGAKQRAKRHIKQSAWLWPLAKKVRASLGRSS